MKHALLRTFAALVSFAFCMSAVQAAPITFNFRFADPSSTAQAVGSVTFESSLLQNPGQNDFDLPNPAVLALNVTVTGSATGNGSFKLADFTGMVFETAGGTLDFSKQLVGQPTSGAPWGTTPSAGEAGDFNLFSGQANRGQAYASRGSAPNGGATGLPPNGDFFFTLGANAGTGEAMLLTSVLPAGAAVATSVPMLSEWTLMALAGLLSLVALISIRRLAGKH